MIFKPFLLHLAIAIFTAYFFNWLNCNYFNYPNKTENGLKDIPENIQKIIIVLIGPIIETFLFQFLPLYFYKSFRKHFLLLIISCTLFSITHIYNPIYFVFSVFLSINFSLFFIKIRKSTNKSFVLTVLLHSLFNLYGMLFVV